MDAIRRDLLDFIGERRFATILADPPGRHFTDSDLAQYGFSLSQIQTGHTVYLPEERVTRYLAADPVKGSATY